MVHLTFKKEKPGQSSGLFCILSGALSPSGRACPVSGLTPVLVAVGIGLAQANDDIKMA